MRKIFTLLSNSKSANSIVNFIKLIKNNIDPVLLFMIFMHIFDFGFLHLIALCLYIIYKSKDNNKKSFNSRVAFS